MGHLRAVQDMLVFIFLDAAFEVPQLLTSARGAGQPTGLVLRGVVLPYCTSQLQMLKVYIEERSFFKLHI